MHMFYCEIEHTFYIGAIQLIRIQSEHCLLQARIFCYSVRRLTVGDRKRVSFLKCPFNIIDWQPIGLK